jgi:hypothetical protein
MLGASHCSGSSRPTKGGGSAGTVLDPVFYSAKSPKYSLDLFGVPENADDFDPRLHLCPSRSAGWLNRRDQRSRQSENRK